MMTNKSLFSFEENIMKWEIALVLKNNEDILEGNQFRSYKFTLEIWYKWKKVEKYKFKKKKKDKTIYKNGQWNMKFDGTEIEEYKFHQYKSPISVSNIDIKKKVVLNMFPFGKQVFKCFIGYKDNKEIILSRNEYI